MHSSQPLQWSLAMARGENEAVSTAGDGGDATTIARPHATSNAPSLGRGSATALGPMVAFGGALE